MDATTIEITSRTETIKSPEIRIPDAIRTDLQNGVARVYDRICTNPPDLIVLPLRSASIAYGALEEKLISNAVKIPTVNAHIGRIIGSHYKWGLEDRHPDDDYEDFEVMDHRDEFERWIQTTDHPLIVSEAVRMIQAIQTLSNRPNHVLLLDDTRSTGETLTVTGPTMIRRAFGDVQVESDFLIHNSSWQSEILHATFGQLSRSENKYMSELMRESFRPDSMLRNLQWTPDSAEKRDLVGQLMSFLHQGQDLVSIDGPDKLHTLEEWVNMFHRNDPPLNLETKFTPEYLVAFPQKLKKVLREV